MPNYYFLSQYEGSGTHLDPYRPLAHRLGQWSGLDIRRDGTKKDGWCFACVTSPDPINTETTSELLYVGSDPDADLLQSTIIEIQNRLEIKFCSTKLAEIIAEILLFRLIPGRGLRPGLDGNFQFNLGEIIWNVTEDYAFEFIGQIRERLGHFSTFGNDSKELRDLRQNLQQALDNLAIIVNTGRPDWLNNELRKVEQGKSSNPFAKNYYEASQVLRAENSIAAHQSHAPIWILCLDRDISLTKEHITNDRLSSRLRNSNDCEPTKYELYIMAGYISAGFCVRVTDANSTGEFQVLVEGTSGVHIECKYKNIQNIGPRKVKAVFDEAAKQFRNLMEDCATTVLAKIQCRTDPIDRDLPGLMECISSSLATVRSDTALSFKHGGKFQIELIPGELLTTDSGCILPSGIDYGFSEATMGNDASGNLRPMRTRGMAWNVSRPGGWIRSVIESVRQAASQLPASSPNIIYVHVPMGTLGAMTTRVETVAPEIEELISGSDSHKRVNAVILTGEAIIPPSDSSQALVVRFIYKTIVNGNPRNSPPIDFRIFGRDFTRTRKSK